MHSFSIPYLLVVSLSIRLRRFCYIVSISPTSKDAIGQSFRYQRVLLHGHPSLPNLRDIDDPLSFDLWQPSKLEKISEVQAT